MRYIFACVLLAALLAAPSSLFAQPVEELVEKLAEPEAAPEAVFKLAAKGGEATGALIKALSSKDSGVRYHALWALTVSDEEIDGSVFAKLLDDKDPLVRLRAVFALSAKAPGRTMPILQRLASDSDRLVRASAATVLAQRRKPVVTDALLKSLEFHKNRFAAVALVSHGEAAAPGLRKLLASDNPVVRRMACFALGRIGDRESLDSLSAAARDKDPDVALSAAVALALMHQDEAYSLLEAALKKRGQSAQEVPAILKKVVKAVSALSGASGAQKMKAFAELGRYGFLPPIPEFIEALRNGKDADMRAAAAKALGEVGSDLGLCALTEASGDREKPVRLAVAIALGRIAAREGVAALRQLSYDPDPDVRAAAAVALARLDIRDLSPIFKRMAADPEKNVRLAAFGALDFYPPSFTEPVFISLLKKEKDPELRALLIILLGRIATENALHIIMKEVDSPHNQSRLAAIEALGNFAQLDAAQKLISVLRKERSDDEKAAAVRALGKTGGELAAPVLMDLFGKAKGDVKLAATEAIGNLKSKDAVPVLISALPKADPKLTIAVIVALGQIAAPSALPCVISLARDESQRLDVRREAVLALGNFKTEDTAKTVARTLLNKDGLAVEAATALCMLGEDVDSTRLYGILNKESHREPLRLLRLLRLFGAPEGDNLLVLIAKRAEGVLAIGAALELVRRDQVEGVALLQSVLAKQGDKARKALEEVLKEFELSQVLYSLMEKLAGTRETKTRMAIVEVLGRLEITDFRIPRDASLADYQGLAARWIRWWEATTARLPGGPGGIRKEEGETGEARGGTMRGLDWLKKKK